MGVGVGVGVVQCVCQWLCVRERRRRGCGNKHLCHTMSRIGDQDNFFFRRQLLLHVFLFIKDSSHEKPWAVDWPARNLTTLHSPCEFALRASNRIKIWFIYDNLIYIRWSGGEREGVATLRDQVIAVDSVFIPSNFFIFTNTQCHRDQSIFGFVLYCKPPRLCYQAFLLKSLNYTESVSLMSRARACLYLCCWLKPR